MQRRIVAAAVNPLPAARWIHQPGPPSMLSPPPPIRLPNEELMRSFLQNQRPPVHAPPLSPVAAEFSLPRKSFQESLALLASQIECIVDRSSFERTVDMAAWIRAKFLLEWRAGDPSLVNRILLKGVCTDGAAAVGEFAASALGDFGAATRTRLQQLFSVKDGFLEERLGTDPFATFFVLLLQSQGAVDVDGPAARVMAEEMVLCRSSMRTLWAVGSRRGLLPPLGEPKGDTAAKASPPDAQKASPSAKPAALNVPEVQQVTSRHNNMQYIKSALECLHDRDADLAELQWRLERDCLASMSAKMQAELEETRRLSGGAGKHPVSQSMINQWHGLLTGLIRKRRERKDPKDAFHLGLVAPLGPDLIAAGVLQQLLRINAMDTELGGYKAPWLSANIGDLLQREVFAEQLKQFQSMTSLKYANLAAVFARRQLLERSMRKVYGELQEKEEAAVAGWVPPWTEEAKVQIGSLFLHLAVQSLRFSLRDGVEKPLLQHAIVPHRGKMYGVVRFNPEVMSVLTAAAMGSVTPEPWAMPMLVPPKPWLSLGSGGYLSPRSRHFSVRTKEDPLQKAILKDCAQRGGMDAVLEGLDVLGRTPWTINEYTLRLAIALWNDHHINVATLEPYSPAQINSSTAQPLVLRRREDFAAAPQTYAAHVRQFLETRQKTAESFSLLSDTNYKLEIARHFAGRTFYLPHSVDFRGRAYPIPPHLSHVASDFSRGLLCFAEAKPLGTRGLYWLKLHVANMFGYDKDERVRWTEDRLAQIRAACAAPLEDTWWRSAEEPWQFIAACNDLVCALDSDSPAAYCSRVPVQQDGSCNGLQHYAALGGDVHGAHQVNLAPADKPGDVYAAVARLVNDQIARDAQHEAADGGGADRAAVARALLGRVNRKIIKQPVMTKVYGVTIYGARKQIAARLREYDVVPKELADRAAAYLASCVFEGIKGLFGRAGAIQDWLTRTARSIGRSVPEEVATELGMRPGGNVFCGEAAPGEREAVVDPTTAFTSQKAQAILAKSRFPQVSLTWTTPLGLQVCQPYMDCGKIELKTCMQSMTLRKPRSSTDPVNERKQTAAFPPNFIHSLDATHMFMTALACYRRVPAGADDAGGITFASVHDCFWTHACTVDDMNAVLREQFVALYRQPILQNLAAELRARYANHWIPVVRRQLAGAPGAGAEADGEGEFDSGLDAGPGIVGPRVAGLNAGLRAAAKPRKGWRRLVIEDPPERGDFDLEQVLQSDYFFS